MAYQSLALAAHLRFPVSRTLLGLRLNLALQSQHGSINNHHQMHYLVLLAYHVQHHAQLSYPEATSHPEGALRLAEKIAAWRALIPEHDFRPHMTNEWIDLVDDPDFPRTPLRGEFTLRTGRNGLIQLLEEWQAAGVNHAAIGIQYSERPALEVLQEIAEEVLPHFPSHQGIKSRLVDW